MRLIDADALIKKFENMGLGEHGLVERIFADGVYAVIENAPTIEAETVRHGIWTTMVHTDTGEFAGYKCSECGMVEYRNYDRCRCGAIMDGGAS